jgi:DNA-binding MarR family transcriptional regulator
LERLGFVSRRPSDLDARVVLMSLTEKARRGIARLAVERTHINNLIFGKVTKKDMALLSKNMAKICDQAQGAAMLLKAKIPST